VRERDIIFGLFSFYDLMIEKYKEKYDIKEKVEIDTNLIQKLIDKKKLGEEDIRLLKESEILPNVDFSKVGKIAEKEVQKKKEKPRYYL
jgi:hypothetical protein